MKDRVLASLCRIPGAITVWQRFPLGSVETRVRFGVWSRPHYAFGIYSAASLAQRLKLPGITVMEFGVAGGRGLLAMEEISQKIAETLGVRIDVVGFDSGSGMPSPVDHRDLPHVWGQGFYRMDEALLRSKLTRAELILGDVADTVPAWTERSGTLPIGFVAFDLDYYSSTKRAFRLFEGGPETRLPRVYAYFDDIMWPEHACHNEYVGELCAIREFNDEHAQTKLCPVHLLSGMRPHPESWNDQMYVLHDFAHPLYCQNVTPVGDQYTQLAIG